MDRATQYGRIEIGPAPADHPFQDLMRYDVSTYIWMPPPRYAVHLPANFRLHVCCVRNRSSGFRRFFPTTRFVGDFIVRAAAGGMATIEVETRQQPKWEESGAAVRNDYRFRQLVYQWGFNDKRSLNREIARPRDLSLKQNERPDVDTKHILPMWLETRGSDGQTRPMSVPEFLQEGRTEAQRLGITSFTDLQLVRLSIVAVARTNPFQVERRQQPDLLRILQKSLLEDVESADNIEASDRALIEEHVWRIVQKYDGLTGAEFHRKFFQDFDNLVSQIKKRVQIKKNALSRAQVRQALRGLICGSFQTISQLVRMQMQLFRLSLPEGLTPTEQASFDALFDSHAWCGNLVPWLFFERFPLLEPLISELQDSTATNAAQHAVVNALLIHAQMVKARREADSRRSKNSSNARARYQNSMAADHSENSQESEVFSDLDEREC